MPRGQLPKAYLRMDPDLDAKHPDNLSEFIRLMCAANRQPRRGRFRSLAVVEAIIGKRPAKQAVDRGDFIPSAEHECGDCPPGTPQPGELYLDGWDTWQEGDRSVAERMRNYRGRKRNDNRNANRNAGGNGPPRNDVTVRLEAGDNKTVPTEPTPEPPNPHAADDIEVLADGLLRHPATPNQLRAIRGLSRQVPKGRAEEVMRYWLTEGNADDPFGAALDQLGAEAAHAKKRKKSAFAYMDEPSAA